MHRGMITLFGRQSLQGTLDGFRHRLCKVLFRQLNGVALFASQTHLNVTRVQPSHADPSVFREVDACLLGQLRDLLGGQTGEGEHADLRFDVSPFSGCVKLDERVVKLGSHVNDPVGHSLDFD